jgi:hypothetical protein
MSATMGEPPITRFPMGKRGGKRPGAGRFSPVRYAANLVYSAYAFVADAATPELDEGGPPDQGADGPANAARNSRIRKIAGEWRGSATKDNAIRVRAFDDSTMFDLMHARGQLSDAQHRAAAKLYRLWTNAGRNPRMTSVYGQRVGVGGSPIADGVLSPLDLYRAAIRQFRGIRADLLETVMLGVHPGTFALQDYQHALDDLVAEWGLEDHNQPEGRL